MFAITELQVTVLLHVIIRLYSKRGNNSIHNSETERAKVSSISDILCKREEFKKKMQFLHIDVTWRAFDTSKLMYFINFEPANKSSHSYGKSLCKLDFSHKNVTTYRFYGLKEYSPLIRQGLHISL